MGRASALRRLVAVAVSPSFRLLRAASAHRGHDHSRADAEHQLLDQAAEREARAEVHRLERRAREERTREQIADAERIAMSSGIRPRKSIPSSAAAASAPPRPNGSDTSPSLSASARS